MKKKNKLFIILTIFFLVCAFAFLILGLVLSGKDIIGWLTSQYAVLFYIVFGTYGLIILFIWLGDKIKRL